MKVRKYKNTRGLSGKIKLIVLLMIITISSIVAFQVNWLSNSYKIWNDQFNADVRESLTTAVEKSLQRKFAEYTTSFSVPGISNITVVSVDSILRGENLFFEFNDSDLISEESFEDIHEIRVRSDSFKREFNLKNIFSDSYNEIHDIIDSSALEFKTEIVIHRYEPGEEDKPIDAMEYTIVMNNMIDSFVNTYMYHDEDVNDNSYQEFTERLSKELISRNIGIDYNVGVYDFENSKFDYLFPENIDTAAFESAYKIPIFDKLDSPDYVSVYFPGKRRYMLLQLWPSILASLILILITVFSFIYILLTIYRQKKLSEIKNDFINNMTHELKTPITTVSLAIEALKDFNVLASKDQTEKYLDIAEGENKRLSLLVDRILQAALYQRDELKLNFENIELNVAISDVIRNVDVQINKIEGQITYEFSNENSEFMVDRVHFNNMIYNLLDNAIKYSESSPEINVSTVVEDRGILIKVGDNGVGISKQHQERIFEKFYRIPTGNLHRVKGYGLGLSYVKEIVEMHGGEISIQSELGQGSVFSVFLPYKL